MQENNPSIRNLSLSQRPSKLDLRQSSKNKNFERTVINLPISKNPPFELADTRMVPKFNQTQRKWDDGTFLQSMNSYAGKILERKSMLNIGELAVNRS